MNQVLDRVIAHRYRQGWVFTFVIGKPVVRYVPSHNQVGLCSFFEKTECWSACVRLHSQRCADTIGCIFQYNSNLMYFHISLPISRINILFNLFSVSMYCYNRAGTVNWFPVIPIKSVCFAELFSPRVASSTVDFILISAWSLNLVYWTLCSLFCEELSTPSQN